MHDLDKVRATRALLCNHHRQRVHMDADEDSDDDDRRRREGDRAFSPGLVTCGGAWRLSLGAEGGDGSCGSGEGDEGGDVVIVVVGPRRAGINEEVAAASDDDRAALGPRRSDMLDFRGMGLNCERNCDCERPMS
jgi:hypothetical protein